AEAPARAIQHRDLVAVHRLPRDGGTGTDAARPQSAGDARDAIGKGSAGDPGQDDVERRAIPWAAATAVMVRPRGFERRGEHVCPVRLDATSSRRWRASLPSARCADEV